MSEAVHKGTRYASDRDRITRRIDIDANGCWLWGGTLTGKGYGRISARGALYSTHRFAYTTFVGPIPDGLTLDHLCGVRRCVNPAHLEPVSQRINSLRSPNTLNGINARKTHCPKGHRYDEANTYVIPSSGGRMCRTCISARNAAARAARRAARSQRKAAATP